MFQLITNVGQRTILEMTRGKENEQCVTLLNYCEAMRQYYPRPILSMTICKNGFKKTYKSMISIDDAT